MMACLCLIRTTLLLFFFKCTCARVCLCVHHGNLSVYVVGGVAKQISNPWVNPSSRSDYKSAGALRSNQQEQSAASADTVSIRGHRRAQAHQGKSETLACFQAPAHKGAHAHTHDHARPGRPRLQPLAPFPGGHRAGASLLITVLIKEKNIHLGGKH